MNIRSHIAWKRALSGGRGEQSPEPGRDGEGAGAGGRPHPGDRRKEGADSLVTSLGKLRFSVVCSTLKEATLRCGRVGALSHLSASIVRVRNVTTKERRKFRNEE